MATTRDALLDAAYDAAVAGTWSKARMADVAAAAGVSRQTLYNFFGSKDRLAGALTVRETERFLAGTARAIAGERDPVAAVRAAAAYTLAEAADSPLLKAVLTGTTPELLPFVTTRAEIVYRIAADAIAADLARLWPDFGADDVGLATEVAVRLTLSFLVSPSGTVESMSDRIAAAVARILTVPKGARS